MSTIIGLCGSLRHGSFNRMLLRAAVEMVPQGTVIETESIREIPLYDGDIEDEQGVPPPSSDSRTGSLKQMAY